MSIERSLFRYWLSFNFLLHFLFREIYLHKLISVRSTFHCRPKFYRFQKCFTGNMAVIVVSNVKLCFLFLLLVLPISDRLRQKKQKGSVLKCKKMWENLCIGVYNDVSTVWMMMMVAKIKLFFFIFHLAITFGNMWPI